MNESKITLALKLAQHALDNSAITTTQTMATQQAIRAALDDNYKFVPAFLYLDRNNLDAARAYIQKRSEDAAKLRKEMTFHLRMTDVLQCRIYGHSILLELVPGTLHDSPCACEFLPNGCTEPEWLEHVDQAIAYILATNW